LAMMLEVHAYRMQWNIFRQRFAKAVFISAAMVINEQRTFDIFAEEVPLFLISFNQRRENSIYKLENYCI